MNHSVKILLILLMFYCCIVNSYAQDISVQFMIGKNQEDVVKNYGKPNHKDSNDPAMICLFYKDKIKNIVFVSDEKEVYQAEATGLFDSETEARSKFSEVIQKSILEGFISDTVSVNNIHIHKKGVKADINLSVDKNASKYSIQIKASRHNE